MTRLEPVPRPTEVDVWCLDCEVSFTVDAVEDGAWITTDEPAECPECGREVEL